MRVYFNLYFPCAFTIKFILAPVSFVECVCCVHERLMRVQFNSCCIIYTLLFFQVTEWPLNRASLVVCVSSARQGGTTSVPTYSSVPLHPSMATYVNTTSTQLTSVSSGYRLCTPLLYPLRCVIDLGFVDCILCSCSILFISVR